MTPHTHKKPEILLSFSHRTLWEINKRQTSPLYFASHTISSTDLSMTLNTHAIFKLKAPKLVSKRHKSMQPEHKIEIIPKQMKLYRYQWGNNCRCKHQNYTETNLKTVVSMGKEVYM